MANKKKKSATKAHQQKQKKQQRRTARTRKRTMPGARPSVAQTAPRAGSVLDDLRPLLNFSTTSEAPSMGEMEKLMMAALGSEDLADEPEFDAVIIPPIDAINAFSAATAELGIDPETFATNDDPESDEEEDQRIELFEKATTRLLTDELRQEMIDGLTALRARWKAEGRLDDVPQAAAVQMFLESEQPDEVVAAIGLVQALVRRALDVGFTLVDAAPAFEPAEGESPLSFAELSQHVKETGEGEEFDRLLSEKPEMRRFLEKQMDSFWEQGEKAVFSGELDLDLFTEEELEAAFQITDEVLDSDAARPDSFTDLTREQMATLIARLTAYVDEHLLLPPRRAQFVATVETASADPANAAQWAPFLLMLKDELSDESDESIPAQRRFLLLTLLGQVLATLQSQTEDEETPA